MVAFSLPWLLHIVAAWWFPGAVLVHFYCPLKQFFYATPGGTHPTVTELMKDPFIFFPCPPKPLLWTLIWVLWDATRSWATPFVKWWPRGTVSYITQGIRFLVFWCCCWVFCGSLCPVIWPPPAITASGDSWMLNVKWWEGIWFLDRVVYLLYVRWSSEMACSCFTWRCNRPSQCLSILISLISVPILLWKFNIST